MDTPKAQAPDHLDDLLGPPASALDHPMAGWRWASTRETVGAPRTYTLRGLADEIMRETCSREGLLKGHSHLAGPMVKLVTFAGSRGNDSMVAVSGIEGDYDGKPVAGVTVAEAVERLRAAGIAALVVTTRSHTPEAPRWRAFAALSWECAPAERYAMAARLNGALGGILSGETFTPSQGMFIAGVAGRPRECVLVDGDFLDRVAGVEPIGKPGGGAAAGPGIPVDEREAHQAEAQEEAARDAERNASAMAWLLQHPTDAGYKGDWEAVVQAMSYCHPGDEGKARWLAWAAASPRAARDDVPESEAEKNAKSDWRTYSGRQHGRPSGFGKVRTLARSTGWRDTWEEARDTWRWERTVARWRAELDDDTPYAASPETEAAVAEFDSIQDRLIAKEAAPADNMAALDKPDAAGWTFERFSAARLPESLPYLVRGLLDQDTAACVYGRSNAGKTFVVMDLAYHIATGQRWLHRDVQQAAVLYLALEGGTGFVRRVLGLREANGEDREIPFYFRRGGARLHGKHVAEDVREILGMVAAVRREAAAEGLPVLVVIDTLSRALAGGDENSSADMGGFVRAVDTIRQKGNATVLVVHHTGKDEARGMRGHSAFLGAIDTEIEVVRQEGDGFGTVLIKKQRDHEGERPLSGFGLRGVTIGRDAEGADVKTAVVDWGDADLMDPPGFSELTTGAKTAWRCFERLLSEAGGEATGVGKSSLRDAVGAHSGGKCSSSRINYANKAVRALAQAGFITCASGADVWHRVDTAKSST